MAINTPQTEGQSSPFFSLMSEAEQIQVQEIQEGDASQERSFIVKIRNRNSQLPDSPPVTPRPKHYFSEAEVLLANGDYLLARNLFSYQLKKNLRDERAMEGLGICFLKLKEILAAKKCFKALWEMYRKSRHAVYLGLCYVQEQNTDAALSLFEQVVSPRELDPELRYEYFKAFGNQLMVKQKWQEAESQYSQALSVRPRSPGVLVNLGTLELQRKKTKESLDYFTRALVIEPNNSKALCGLGLLELEKGATENAQLYFERALDQDSQNALALRCLLSLQASSRATPELKNRVFIFLKKEPKHGEIRFAYANLLLQENRFSEALEQADEALKALPQDSRILKLKKILTENRHWGKV